MATIAAPTADPVAMATHSKLAVSGYVTLWPALHYGTASALTEFYWSLSRW